jgi:hypothetical protein
MSAGPFAPPPVADVGSATDDFLDALKADVPMFVESDVGAAQLVSGLRAAGLSMRLDPYKGQ